MDASLFVKVAISQSNDTFIDSVNEVVAQSRISVIIFQPFFVCGSFVDKVFEFITFRGV